MKDLVAGEVVTARTVDSWLSDVDYHDDPMYQPSAFALEFIIFIKMVNGGQGEENRSPVLHFKMLDQIVTGDTRIANMIHRGAAKTTLMGEYLFLYLGVYGELPGFGKIELALYVSDSIDNGVKNMRKNLEFRYENSAFLQQYTLLEKLGKGHFAEVFLCIEKSTGQRYAVKIFTKQPGVEERSKTEGLQQEIAVLMGVSHPNMLCLKDTFDEPNAVYLVLELAAEGELFNWIVMKQKLTEDETRKVFIQLFQGVKYLVSLRLHFIA